MTSPLLVLERAVQVCEAFEAAGLPHALGGALCLAYHVQEPRGTNDIDVNVTCDPQDPGQALRALPPQVPWSAHDERRAVVDGQVRLHWGPRPVTALDLFFPQHDFHRVAAGRTERVPMLDTTVPILSATDLTVFKALFDRTKDWADIEELLRYGDVDEDEVRRWLVDVVGPDDDRLTRLAAAARVARSADDEPSTARLFRGQAGEQQRD